MGIISNMKTILKFKFLPLICMAVFCFVTPLGVEAKTVTDSTSFADSTRYEYIENLFYSSNYKSYLMTIENTSSGYTNYSSYYICFTNENITYTNSLNASANCDELLNYYRNSNGDYQIQLLSDSTLEAVNSVYYTSNISYTDKIIAYSLFTICLGVFCFYLTYVILKVFRS